MKEDVVFKYEGEISPTLYHRIVEKYGNDKFCISIEEDVCWHTCKIIVKRGRRDEDLHAC